MKKFLFVLLAMLLVFSFVACDEPEQTLPHEHSWDNGTVTKEATCTATGVKTYKCSCGEIRTETISALGHSFGDWVITNTQTCIDNGSQTRTCSKCDATETETIKYDNTSHDYTADATKCSVCEALKTDIETAEARVGKTYYPNFADAVNEAQKLEVSDRVVEVLKETIDFAEHAPQVNNSITINCNGADFNRKDLAVYTYDSKVQATDNGNVNIIINDANNLELWGQFSKLPADTIVNVTMNNVHNEGSSVIDSNGYLVMFRGADATANSIINLSINNCSVTKVNNGVHFIYNGIADIKDCTFTEVAVPVNFAHKGTEGKLDLTVENCNFTNCGANDADGDVTLAAYSAPIRLTQTGEGSSAFITIKGNTVIGTRSNKGDVLLVDDRDGKTILPLTAKFESNTTELKVLAEKGEEFVTINANESREIKAGTKH